MSETTPTCAACHAPGSVGMGRVYRFECRNCGAGSVDGVNWVHAELPSNETTFEVGNTVALKSGGPAMTVVDVYTPRQLTIEVPIQWASYLNSLARSPITCQWFHDGEVRSGRFQASSLVKVAAK